jgi:succinoglycan biosynthesis protein ExoU
MNLGDNSVCVIVAAYNAQDMIGRAVTSALQQDYVREVIVVDDASQDETVSSARQHDDGSGRLSIIPSTENKGPSAARNAALARSISPYFCTLDADDYFLPRRISQLLAAAKSTSWDMIADDILIVPEAQQHRAFSVLGSEPPHPCNLLDLESFVNGNISRPRRPRAELGFLKPIIKRTFLQQHGLGYDERLRLGEDYALYARALIAGARFYLASACGYVAIEREASISSAHSGADLARLADFDTECLNSSLALSRTQRRALAAHRTATLRKYWHRAMLDLKRDRGMAAALAFLAKTPSSIPHIAEQTLRAKLLRRFQRVSNHEAGFRFVVGTAETRLSLSANELPPRA